MSRFTFSNFGNLPILAKTFWNVPKYLPDIPDKQTFNKIVGIYRPEFKATCIFTHKTNITEMNFSIKSDFVFMSEKFRMEESCRFANIDAKEQFEVNYSFTENKSEEQMFIYEKKIGTLPVNIQNAIKQIEEILEKNRDKCVIS